MAQVDAQLSTGLPGLDKALKGLIPGDNLLWQVDSIEDYIPFVRPYCASALERGKKLVYFRFAKHEPLLGPQDKAEIHELHPEAGFESFITDIHKVIERVGGEGFYVFDCLSELVVDWYSDQMLGNFFMLTCPYLYDVAAIAYFMLLRNYHSSRAITPIADTTQVFIDVYRHDGRLYIHPRKVQQRYSPTMYMLHVWRGEEFPAVTESTTISEVLNAAAWTARPRSGGAGYASVGPPALEPIPWLPLEAASTRLGIWNRTFLLGQEICAAMQRGEATPQEGQEVFHRLLRMALSRDERVLGLLKKHLTLTDVLEIGNRMIGTGLIGGKSVGMLLARAILRQTDARWEARLEPHDSFYIGSDAFYTFLVRNGIWWVRQKQRDPSRFLEGAETARQRILTGEFPDYLLRQFEYMLDYFGQSPIIVRSSSLLEDNFGNAFAGKYESVFCANQGPRHKRLEDFLSAVRTIYASTMSEKALRYRAQKGILDRDEQMALLVQRVSGAMYGDLYYPQIAGVGFSFNPYVWSEYIMPEAGMIRLVFGLGTRAVDRSDDDYTRVVALNAPQRRPEANFDQVRQYAQRKVDVLDLEANQLVSMPLQEVMRRSHNLPIEMFAARDEELLRRAAQGGVKDPFPWVLTFDRLFTKTDFVPVAREMLQILQRAYDYPVDVEFTANFFDGGDYRVNLVQCRPFQVKGGGITTQLPQELSTKDIVLEARGAVIGQSRVSTIDRLVYVVPKVYGRLPIGDRHAVARLLGRVLHVDEPAKPQTIMLMGPGRWGTTTPSLGVPVSFADINTVSILCEIVAMRDDLIPDVSLGTHFFNELVEMDILYLALFPHQSGNFINSQFMEQSPNRLAEFLPDAADWAGVLRIIDPTQVLKGATLKLNANTLGQKVICYIDRDKSN